MTILDRIEVGYYVESSQHYASRTGGRILRLIAARGITRHVVEAGDVMTGFGDVRVTILHPRASFVNRDVPTPEGLNNGSVVLRVDYAGYSLLLTGDIEHGTDGALVA